MNDITSRLKSEEDYGKTTKELEDQLDVEAKEICIQRKKRSVDRCLEKVLYLQEAKEIKLSRAVHGKVADDRKVECGRSSTGYLFNVVQCCFVGRTESITVNCQTTLHCFKYMV